jgi:predicted metalloendopeptidase
MTTLTNQDITKFWLRVYFGSGIEKYIVLSAIDRAYRDFNRTMHGMAEIRKRKINAYIELRSLMNEIVSEILNKDFKQVSFDSWHKDSCDSLIIGFKKSMDYELNYGQAQKWPNLFERFFV